MLCIELNKSGRSKCRPGCPAWKSVPAIVLFLLCLGCNYAFSKATILDTRNGLNSNVITAIMKDDRGLMWIGTNSGLNVFDGYTITRMSEVIGKTDVFAIVNDKKRRTIWVGTGKGLYRINALSFQITKCSINGQPSSVPALAVTVNERTGDVYAVMKNGQIISLRNQEMASLGNFFEPLNSVVTATCLDDQLLVYTDKMFKFSKKSVSLEPVYDFENQMPFLSLTQHADTIVATSPSYGILLINAASLTNISTAVSRSINTSEIRSAVVNNKDLLVSGNDYSFKRFDLATGRVDSISTRYREVFEGKLSNVIFIDEQNIIWIGTNKGIIKVEEDAQQFVKLLNDQTPRTSTRNIIEDGNGDIYAGSYNGLYHYNKTERKWQLYNRRNTGLANGSNHVPIALLADKNGRYIYFGCDEDASGFFRFDKVSKTSERVPANGVPVPLSSDVTALAYDGNGKIWLGLSNGLATYDPSGRIWIHSQDIFSIGKTRVNSITLSRNSNLLYIGTTNGVYILNTGTGITAHFSTQTSVALSHNDVSSIFEDTRGNLWVATHGGGISIISASRLSVSYLRRQNGLCNDIVYGVLPETPNTYWISTYNGLTHYDQRTGIFKAFYEEDGLSTNEFNRGSFLKSSSGSFYFGGINGITSFSAKEVNTNLPGFEVFVSGLNRWEASSESMKLSRNMLGTGEVIEKRSSDLILELYFSCTDYSDPLRNTYLYRIAGVNDKWMSLDDRHILNLSGIPVGDYLVEVKALNQRGTVSSNMLRFNLRVVQPFYREWWFFLVLLSGVAIVILVIYRINIRAVKGLHQLRVKIASNLHDEVGSLLTRITMFSDNLRYGRNNDEQRNVKLEKIAALSRNATNSMSDVLWAIDARNDITGNLLDRMHEHAEEMLLPLQVNIVFDTHDVNQKQSIHSETRRELYLIFKEAVNNIVKHANAQNVRIMFRQKEKHFSLLVENDGISPESKSTSTGQGLENMRLRARRINASFEQVVHHGKFVVKLKR